MKLVIISPYPPTRCGVAKYTQTLALELAKRADVSVLSDHNCWRKNSFRAAFNIFFGVTHERPKIVHMQFEYLLFGKGEFSILLLFPMLLFRLFLCRVVVTMHSVIPSRILSPNFFQEYTQSGRLSGLKRFAVFIFTFLLCNICSDQIVVHTEHSKEILERDYYVNPEKIRLIPHFSFERGRPLSPSWCKRVLGLEGNIVLVQFGFIKPLKGIDLTIEAMELLKNEKMILLVVGDLPPQSFKFEKEYYEKLVRYTRGRNLPVVWAGYVADDQLPLYLGAADVFVFPYRDEASGSSGALNTILPYGKAIVASCIPKFSGLQLFFFEPDNPHDLARKLKEATQVARAPLRGYELAQAIAEHFSIYAEFLQR